MNPLLTGIQDELIIFEQLGQVFFSLIYSRTLVKFKYSVI